MFPGMSPSFWRKWHRWIGFVAAIFLLFASLTGILVAFTEFFGEEEELREATRALVSPVRVGGPNSAWSEPLSKAFATAAGIVGGAPIDKITLQFKGDAPTVDMFIGKPSGGEDRRLIFNLHSGALVRNETYTDKPLIHRIHSGEFFGDGGLVISMIWGLALALLAASGIVIYFTMRRPGRDGLRKVFW
jgi:uncharacterized iron-regulated membrane protein